MEDEREWEKMGGRVRDGGRGMERERERERERFVEKNEEIYRYM
jgi:hypothetical protein